MSIFVILNKQIGKVDQNVDYTETLKHDATGTKCRVHIRSNPYAFQSYAVAEVWSPTMLKWNEACKVLNMTTKTGLYITGPMHVVGAKDFQVDRDNLVNQLKAILA